MKGSFTIEAAMNFCCVVICLVFCVYMGLYMHDKTVLEGAAVRAAQQGRVYAEESQSLTDGTIDWELFESKGLLWRLTGSVKEAEIAEYAGKLAAGKLLVCDTPEFTVEASSDKVTVSYRAKTLLKGLYFSGVGLTIPEISGKVTESGMEAEEFLRLVRAIMEGR